MRRVAFAGLSVGWSVAAGLEDPVFPLLHGLPSADDAPAIRIVVEPLLHARPARETQFFFDDVTGHHDHEGAHLASADGHVDVAADGRSIRVAVRPGPLPPTFHSRAVLVGLVLAAFHHGVHHVHAASLVDDDVPLWLCGGSGSGKSTSTIALVGEGFGFLTDDCAFVRRDTRVVHALPLPFHVTTRTVEAFPAIEPFVEGAPYGTSSKRCLDAARAWPSRVLRASAAPRILLFPRVGAAATTITPLAPADALGRLLACSAWSAVPGMAAPKEHLELLGAIVDGARPFALDLGPDVLRDPGRLARIVRSAYG